jgi:hypothetical protein
MKIGDFERLGLNLWTLLIRRKFGGTTNLGIL